MKYILSLFIALWSIAAWGQEEGMGSTPPTPENRARDTI